MSVIFLNSKFLNRKFEVKTHISYPLLKEDVSYKIGAREEKERGISLQKGGGKSLDSHWLVFIMGLLHSNTTRKQSQLNVRMRY